MSSLQIIFAIMFHVCIVSAREMVRLKREDGEDIETPQALAYSSDMGEY